MAQGDCPRTDGLSVGGCQASCCALGGQATSATPAGLAPQGLVGARLVWRAIVGLILPGLLWIGVVWQLSGPLGELAACAIGVLAWLSLLLLVRASVIAVELSPVMAARCRVFRTARQGPGAERAGTR